MTSRADPRTPRARRLRHEATPQERKLWVALRQIEWPGGGHFRRQVPIGPYYADFAHHGLKLVVELDGGQHSPDDAVRRDSLRTADLESRGYRVVRFWNAEIADNFDGVVETIYAAAVDRARTVAPCQPSPREAAGRADSGGSPSRVGGGAAYCEALEFASTPPTPVRLRNRSGGDSALPAASGGRVGVAAIALFIAALAFPAIAHAAQSRQIGAWLLKWGPGRVGPYCTVETVQGGRTFGYQVLKTGQRFFGLRDPAWNWSRGEFYDARLGVSGGAQWGGKAIAALPDTLVLGISADVSVDPAEAFKAGRSIVVEVGGQASTFDLKGFSAAAQAQRDCLAQPG